jgi:hypothetical protein
MAARYIHVCRAVARFSVRLDQNDAIIQLKNHPIQMTASASFGLMITTLRLTLLPFETLDVGAVFSSHQKAWSAIGSMGFANPSKA